MCRLAAIQQLQLDNEKMQSIKYWRVIISLSVCLFCHSYLLISVFPYSGFMAIFLIPRLNREDAGSYAGFLASAFMLGRVLCSYPWGKFADRHGRKIVLCISLGLSTFFSLCFGFVTSFKSAMLIRFFLGLSNGILVTTKTLISELANGNDELEKRGMGIVMGMWGWGFLICPVISGALAEPVRQYPNSTLVKKFYFVLSSYPFLLPNLIGAILCLFSLVFVMYFIDETVANHKQSDDEGNKSLSNFRVKLYSWCNLSSTYLSSYNVVDNCSNTDKTDQSNGQNFDDTIIEKNPIDIEVVQSTTSECTPLIMNSEETQIDDQPAVTMKSLWARKSTRHLLIIQWMVNFRTSCIDEVLPLYCLSEHAGLGLSEVGIGKILSCSGLIFAFLQYFTYSKLTKAYSLHQSMIISIVTMTFIGSFIPVSHLLNKNIPSGRTNSLTFFFLSIILAINRIFGSIFFSSMSITLNKTVPATCRGKMNGLAVLGSSVFKALGPICAGLLFSFCVSSGVFHPVFGSFVVFGLILLYGVEITIISNFYLKNLDNDRRDGEKLVES